MKTSARLYQCCRCQAQVIVCQRCDRGQRYCTHGCSESARTESLKRANKKYQNSRVGRFNNAARQSLFRQRQKQKVTYQGSAQTPRHAVLKATLDKPENTRKTSPTGPTLHCHHCGEVCGLFLRLEFLHSSRFKRAFRRG